MGKFFVAEVINILMSGSFQNGAADRTFAVAFAPMEKEFAVGVCDSSFPRGTVITGQGRRNYPFKGDFELPFFQKSFQSPVFQFQFLSVRQKRQRLRGMDIDFYIT